MKLVVLAGEKINEKSLFIVIPYKTLKVIIIMLLRFFLKIGLESYRKEDMTEMAHWDKQYPRSTSIKKK